MEHRQLFSIADYGAIGDGHTLNTAAIQAAVDACAGSGGGTVVFPKGVFLSGTIRMRGGITYLLERGAVLRGSGSLADYTDNGFYHNELGLVVSLLWARDEEDIRITGDGKIDFSARDFFAGSRIISPVPDESLLTPEQRAEAVLEIRPRPNQPIFFESCRDITIDGVTLLDSPCWTITCSRSRRIQIHHITVRNSLIVPNCDGIHLSACKDVIVGDCLFECGDDCVAVTCITAEGQEDISERILISRCHMRSRSAAVRLGHLKGKVRHVVVSDLVITDSNRGLAVFSGDEGYVEDALFTNITMETRIVAGVWWGKGEAAVICAAGSSGHIRDITLQNIRARSEAGVLLAGTDGNVRDVTLRDIDLRLVKGSNDTLFGGDLDFRPNLFLKGAADISQGVYAEGVENLTTENVRIQG